MFGRLGKLKISNYWVSYPVVLCPSICKAYGMAKPSPSHAGDALLISVGNAIRRARRALGMSQEALALAAELDRSYVGGLERGEHNLTLISLAKIARALDMQVRDLL
jgi:ribosome-binding protein aMBF1 (putative translation factor)